MKKKQRLFLGFTVLAIAVIFTMAGCASMADLFQSSNFPSDSYGQRERAWERANSTSYPPPQTTLSISGSDIYASNQDFYWWILSISGDAYKIINNTDRKTTKTIHLTLVGDNLEIIDDDGSGENDWTGTWRRKNASLNTVEESGVSINSAGELKNYLDGQPANSPDKPITVTVTVNAQTLKDIVDVINSSGKYVSLRLSGNELTAFPANAFANCANLTSITIPNSVSSIDARAFSGCTNLTAINVNSSNANFSSDEGILFSKDKRILLLFPQGSGFTRVTIYADIGPYAFYGSNITSVTLAGGGVTLSTGNVLTQDSKITDYHTQRVYEGAFISCTSLTRVTVDGGGFELDRGSFDGDLFDLWDKATTINLTNGTTGRDVGFRGTFTRPNGTSTTWSRR